MIRGFRFTSYQKKCLNNEVAKRLSTQTAVSFKPNDEDYAKAIPFDQIPGLSTFEMIRRFLPGGKFHNISVLEFQNSLRKEFGDFYRLPAVFGQNKNITTYNADDVEFIHRNEGTYPFRRGLETMKHFRAKIRSDIYEVGGLVNE